VLFFSQYATLQHALRSKIYIFDSTRFSESFLLIGPTEELELLVAKIYINHASSIRMLNALVRCSHNSNLSDER